MNLDSELLHASEVDILLLLEGSYPLVLGGVSAWVHQIIENFPQYNFGLLFLGSSPKHYPDGIRYKLPSNVTYFQIHYLFDEEESIPSKFELGANQPDIEGVRAMHESFKCPHAKNLEQLPDLSSFINNEFSYEQFLYGLQSWDYICEEYTKQCEDSSFIDYFWTIKNIHKPLWALASILKNIPIAKVVHTVSTGYAGLLSFLIQTHYHYPVILTEHGIYTKERKIDIFLNTTFYEEADRLITETSYLRLLWDRYFMTLSGLTYHAANPIISLFPHAQQIQIEDGACSEETIVIPNGIDISRFKQFRRQFEDREPIVCFIGRVVSIKDIKTFLRAIPRMHNEMPELKFWVVGSVDQEPEYAKECYGLVENMMLENLVDFIPHQDIADVLPRIKLLVLCSIRESMPLVILESFAAGIPVVATDVGACEGLLLGMNEDDKNMGPAGKLIKVADSEDLEEAVISILANPELWKKMSQTAIQRVERFYDQKLMIEKYQNIYEGTIT